VSKHQRRPVDECRNTHTRPTGRLIIVSLALAVAIPLSVTGVAGADPQPPPVPPNPPGGIGLSLGGRACVVLCAGGAFIVTPQGPGGFIEGGFGFGVTGSVNLGSNATIPSTA
jgi:hypothetical protein